jgi:preprotein translocase subunit SecD
MKRLTAGALLSFAMLSAASAAEREHVVLSISSISVRPGYSNESVLFIELDPAGAKAMADFSERHVGDLVSILAAGHVVSRAFIREPLRDGKINLTCNQDECGTVAKQVDDAKVITISYEP